MFRRTKNWFRALKDEIFGIDIHETDRPGGAEMVPATLRGSCSLLPFPVVIAMAVVLCMVQTGMFRIANYLAACGLHAILVFEHKGPAGYFVFAAVLWAFLLWVEASMRLRAKHVPVIGLLVYLVGSGFGGLPQAMLHWAGFNVPYPVLPELPWRTPAMEGANAVIRVLMILVFCRWLGTGTWRTVGQPLDTAVGKHEPSTKKA